MWPVRLPRRRADKRFADYFKFITEKKSKVYIQRVFDNSTTTRGKDGPYDVDKMIAGEYGGEPGAATDAVPHLSARTVLGTDSRLDSVLH